MKEISIILNTIRTTISKFFKENNLIKNICRTVKIIPTIEDENVLFGCLLGDGHLTKITNKCKNSCFSYISSKYNHTKFVRDSLLNYSNKIRYRKTLDNRTNKEYISYRFTTILNEYFTELRNKWYPNGIKNIPDDLILTKSICLFWYIGDGHINQNYKMKSTSELILNTNSFIEKDIDKIVSQLII